MAKQHGYTMVSVVTRHLSAADVAEIRARKAIWAKRGAERREGVDYWFVRESDGDGEILGTDETE